MDQVLHVIAAQILLTSATINAPTTMLVWTSLSLARMDLKDTALQALKDAPIMDLYAIHLALVQFFSHVLMDQAVYAMNVYKHLISAWINAPSLAWKSLSLVRMDPSAHAIQALKDAPTMDLSVTDHAPD